MLSAVDSVSVRSFCFPAGRSVASTLSGQPGHAIERFGNDVVDAMQLLRCDDVRRKNVYNVTQRAKQYAFVEIEIVECRTHFRKVTGIVGLEFQGHHSSNGAHVGNGWMPGEHRPALAVNFLDDGDAFEYRLGIENPEASYGRRTAERICRVGVTVKKRAAPVTRAEGCLYRRCAERGCERLRSDPSRDT